MTVITPASALRVMRADVVKVFPTPDGRHVAIDKRSIGFLRHEQTGRTTVALKLSGLKPIPVLAEFDDVHSWWLAPALSVEAPHAPDN